MGKHWCINCGAQYYEKNCPNCYPEDERDTHTKHAEFRHNEDIKLKDHYRARVPQEVTVYGICPYCHEEVTTKRHVYHKGNYYHVECG